MVSSRVFAALSFVVALSLAPGPRAWGQDWGEPIRPKTEPAPETPPPAEPSPSEPAAPEPAAPASSEPNPDWSDAPPTEYEERSPTNPDWVEETEPPPVGKARNHAVDHYDIRYANRALVMPRGMMRGTFDTVVGKRTEGTGGMFGPFGPTGTISTMNFGVAITLATDFEIGFSRYRMGSYPTISLYPSFGFGGEGLITFSMSPEVKFGDIPFYARFQALNTGVVQLAIDAVFRIPSRTEFGFLGGIPLRFVIEEFFAIDTGFEFTVDSNPNGKSVWSLNLPLAFVANATDQLFFKLDSGMHFFDLNDVVRAATSRLIGGPFYFIPLGFGGGYTIEAGRTMLDLFASFRFPTFFGFNSEGSELNAQTWAVTVGLNIYSPVLFKGSAL